MPIIAAPGVLERLTARTPTERELVETRALLAEAEANLEQARTALRDAEEARAVPALRARVNGIPEVAFARRRVRDFERHVEEARRHVGGLERLVAAETAEALAAEEARKRVETKRLHAEATALRAEFGLLLTKFISDVIELDGRMRAWASTALLLGSGADIAPSRSHSRELETATIALWRLAEHYPTRKEANHD